MKTKLSHILLLLLISVPMFSQNQRLWSAIDKESQNLELLEAKKIPTNSKFYTLDLPTLRNLLFSVSASKNIENPAIITIPNINGKLEKFKMIEDSNFAPELQAAFSEIRAYTGSGIDDPTALAKISIAPNGIQAMVLRADKKAEYIEPCSNDFVSYAVFNSRPYSNDLSFNCMTESHNGNHIDEFNNNAVFSNMQTLKKFRLALSCTTEYTTFHGGTVAGALAAMNATMTRVNGVFERDFAVKLEIVADNTAVIFTDATTDPYDNPDVGTASNASTWNGQVQTTLDSIIGSSNYDIGHLFGLGWGSGNAGCIGCICDSNKGSAFSTPTNAPEGDTFDIGTVAHEMGHQLGATHVFSHELQAGGTLIEPGSGTTIMSYAGRTLFYNLQDNSDDYFNSINILQVQANLINKACAVNIPLSNPAPIVSAGPDFTIPKGTPFVLTGTVTATDLNPLTYTWEENDPITSVAFEGDNSFASLTKTAGPNFRPLIPGSSKTRYFPALASVLNNVLSTQSESITNVGRSYRLVFTARDNSPQGGQTSSDNTKITVSDSAGPFDVTSQNTGDFSWVQGTIETITWSVNNTNTLPGSDMVSILLSIDGGLTYPIVLAESTPNDGSADIIVPNIAALFCRVMIKPTQNVYYDINQTNFSIGYLNSCVTYESNTPLIIPDGNGSNSGAAVNSTIFTEPSGIITDVNVTVNTTHTRSSDLLISLISSNNVQSTLWNEDCFLGNNWNFTFNDEVPKFDCIENFGISEGTFGPAFPLSIFNGLDGNDSWTLNVTDVTETNIGQINSWSVAICSKILMTLNTNSLEKSNIILYPNPANTILNFSVPNGSATIEHFLIYNELGQILQQKSIPATSEISIDIRDLSNGIYFLKVSNGSEDKTLKFIKN